MCRVLQTYPTPLKRSGASGLDEDSEGSVDLGQLHTAHGIPGSLSMVDAAQAHVEGSRDTQGKVAYRREEQNAITYMKLEHTRVHALWTSQVLCSEFGMQIIL